MVRDQFIKVIASISLIIIGMISMVLGAIIAAISGDGWWLLLSLGGLVAVLAAVVYAITQLSRAARFFEKITPAPVRRRIKYIKHD